MICKFCNKEYEIKEFIPKNKDETDKFEINKWFFAYCKCDCGEFIIEKKDIQ